MAIVADNTHQDMRKGHHEALLEHMAWLGEIRQWRLDHAAAD